MCTFNSSILNYQKTEHFLKRQWERKIPDEVLVELLSRIKTKQNALYVFSRSMLKHSTSKELFIKTSYNLLITCFYADITEYTFSYSKEAYIIVQ